MSETADVVVVGGGVMGCSLALHLREAGAERVRVLERDGLFEGTSAAGAGFLALWGTFNPAQGEEELAVERYGIEYYRGLQESGHDVDFVHNGTLFVAAEDAGWEQIQSFAEGGEKAINVVIDAERVEALTDGVIAAAEIRGGVLQPIAGQVSTEKVGVAMRELLDEAGVVVETRRPVSALDLKGERSTGVQTPQGPIAADVVVLAAGAWSNGLLEPHGAYLPTVPQITSRIITEELGIPRTMPTLFLMGLTPEPGGTFLWLRRHHGALLWGGTYGIPPRNAFVGNPPPPRLDEVPIDGVLECQRLAAKASRFMPVLNRYRSLTLKHGAPCFTADTRALIGPVPGIEGLFAMAGDNEAGVTHGPGFGKALAETIVHGSNELADIEAWRIDRFEQPLRDDAAVAEAMAAAA
ncbi:MAG: FAD-binding oxidoreductase [Actinobacteria bacterium]|nr:FAD-binding oxidoreductase [Actinomycetota bacterium]